MSPANQWLTIRSGLPYVILGSVLALIVSVSILVPAPSVPPPPEIKAEAVHQLLMDRDSARKLRERYWCVTEQWSHGEQTYSINREGHSPPHFERRFVNITDDTIEITRITPTDWLRTVSVLVVEFDSRQVGSLNAISIEWNETKEDALRLIHEGHGQHGLYYVDQDRMEIYIAEPTVKSPATQIPPHPKFGGQFICLNRKSPDESRSYSDLTRKPNNPTPVDKNGVVHYEIDHYRNHRYDNWSSKHSPHRIEPLGDPIPVEPMRAARYINGWIIQYDIRESAHWQRVRKENPELWKQMLKGRNWEHRASDIEPTGSSE